MSQTYFPLHVHSHYSLLDGISKPKQIIDRITQLDLPGTAITDHGSISSVVQMLKSSKDGKKQLIIGCELYISEFDANVQNDNNRKLTHMLVIAQNDDGWKDLIKLTSEGNKPTNFYYKPRLSIEQLKPYLSKGNLILFGGHYGSTIANMIVSPDGKIDNDGIIKAEKFVLEMKDILGDNFYLEAQLINPEFKSLVEVIREIGKKTGVKVIATADSHYAFKEQAVDQQVALATALNKTLFQCTDPAFGLSSFFKKDANYHIPSYDEMVAFGNTEEELVNTLEVASKCEEYKKILGPPILPPFTTPQGQTVDAYLMELCELGWKNKILSKVDSLESYRERLNYEFKVLTGAKLSSYFLIVQDILSFVRNQGWLPGPGRGSAAGCLVSYLIGITSIDPIKYDLYFERFYNAGRNTADRISMPDIDVDVPVTKREQIIQYIKNKYGYDKVSQMLTYQTMKGRGALKDVLRAHNAVSASEMNQITKHFPEEAKIADELQDMKEEVKRGERDEGDVSIIRWALENDDKGLFKDWCSLDADGKLTGPLARFFDQAIRLEGTKATQSKHAAGILISPEPLSDICPMVYDSKTESMIAGLEMEDAEQIGMIKYDILGVAMLSKMMGISQILFDGDVLDEDGV